MASIIRSAAVSTGGSAVAAAVASTVAWAVGRGVGAIVLARWLATGFEGIAIRGCEGDGSIDAATLDEPSRGTPAMAAVAKATAIPDARPMKTDMTRSGRSSHCPRNILR
jgi:hypothetical protein